MKTIEISIIAPVFNEEAVIEEFYNRITDVLNRISSNFEIIFIDDGSTDKTLDKIKKMGVQDASVKAVSFSRNFGHGMAISAGLSHARGEAVIIIDGDLQDPPEILPEFITKWKEGYDVVYGIRTKRKEWFGKRLAYWFFYRILKKLSNLEIPIDVGDFCLMSRATVDQIKTLPERNPFMRGIRSWVGFRQGGVVYERSRRFAGVTKYSLAKLLKLAVDGIFSFSYIPLRLAVLLGFFIAIVDFIVIGVVLYSRIFGGGTPPRGFASTIIVILFLGSVQLISIGILGEYVARIYEEVKHRPLYIVKERIGL